MKGWEIGILPEIKGPACALPTAITDVLSPSNSSDEEIAILQVPIQGADYWCGCRTSGGLCSDGRAGVFTPCNPRGYEQGQNYGDGERICQNI